MSQCFPSDELPEGVEQIAGTFYKIPFDLIQTSDDYDEDDEGFAFNNPRRLTEKGDAELTDKQLSLELRESIKKHTLLSPLICRWVQDDEGYYPQLVGGERRYRALSYLRTKKEMVSDPNNVRLNDKSEWEYAHSSADKVYSKVICQVFAVNSDLDALALAWAENKNRINLSEGHEIAEVIKLREFDASDEKILEILQREEKWLRETDNLIENLDENTLKDLIECRIDRGSAKELAEIEDLDVREKVRIEANEVAEAFSHRKKSRFQKRVEEALKDQEVARGNLAFIDDSEEKEDAEEQVSEAEQRLKRTVKERDEIKPVTTRTEVKKAKAKVTQEQSSEDRLPRVLSAKKIMKGMELVDQCLDANGLDPEGAFEIPTQALHLLSMIIKENILAGNADFGDTMKRFADTHC
jgi:hypothetical protein